MKKYAGILTAGLAFLIAAPVASAHVQVRDQRSDTYRYPATPYRGDRARPFLDRAGSERDWREHRVRDRRPDRDRHMAAPIIERLNARSAKPGRLVSLRIADFDRGADIFLDDTRVQVVRLERDGDVVVRVPTSMRPGKYWFSVRRGRSEHRAEKSFTLDPPAVIQGIPDQVRPGSVFTIEGRYFDDGVRVFHGGNELRVLSVEPRRLTVQMPRQVRRGGYLSVDDGGIRTRFDEPLRVSTRGDHRRGHRDHRW